jgi:hypothetical protein
MGDYDIIKLLLNEGISVNEIHRRFPKYSKAKLYKYLRIYNLEKFNNSPVNVIYHMPKYNAWRDAVFKRDGYKCIICGHTGSYRNPLQADHIQKKSSYPELMFEVSNGRTLCLRCHKRTLTWGKGTGY